MEPALKQRLIGATVLVALAVIFLPMLLKGPAPDGGATHVPLDLPAAGEDRRMETRELPLVPQPRLPEGGAVSGTDDGVDPDRIVTVDADVAERTDALEGEDVRQAVTERGTAAPADGPRPQPAPTPAPPAPAPAQPAPTPAEPAPQPAPQPAAPPVAAAGGGFAVNLGSYANTGNARDLVRRMQEAGLPAYSEDVTLDGGRSALRVRLGPFAQRAQAEAARQQALGIRSDLPTSVVAVDGSAAGSSAAAPAPRAAAGTGFAVQVGAFRSQSDADALVRQLREGGFAAFSERVDSGSGSLHRVRVGPEVDRAAAERLKSRLPAPYSSQGMVVSHP